MTTPASRDGHDHRLACVNLVPLFADLSADDRRQVADVAVNRHYERGEQVHRPGERPALRIVHRGRLKVHRINESGAEQLLRILFPGDFHGETSLLTRRSVDSWAEALEPAEVCVLGADRVERLLRERPEVALRMLASVSARLADAEQQVSSITGASVARRLGEHLLELAQEAGSTTFRLPSTKKDLASYLGTTPETLSRRLGALQDAGLVRLGAKGLVEIPDPAELRAATAGA
ncbi:Crp/Fnr family transcriptional regulator [Segeticoccus rhizosphaerae]|uniref:Crp/Fnr family transcriptional regulator n=1 Tax=Segeticoccus rhizosphaerae TaxID=1104777 RepID=UPI001265566F|nr:Crp/Fnr family transcriptional regulator [Segeticoccus rhizosphaerae]